MSDDGTGRRRALNHFNKAAKGRFVRALLESAEPPSTLEDLAAWAAAEGWSLDEGAPGELELLVAE